MKTSFIKSNCIIFCIRTDEGCWKKLNLPTELYGKLTEDAFVVAVVAEVVVSALDVVVMSTFKEAVVGSAEIYIVIKG